MRSLFALEHFDPLKGKSPEYVEGAFQGIAYRARQILANRTSEEIVTASEIISWLIEQYADDGYITKELESIPLTENEEEDFAHFRVDETHMLTQCIDKYDLDIKDDIPNVTWGELFATLALTYIGEACEHETNLLKKGYPEDDSMYLTLLAPYAVEAMEAVCMAESLQREQQVKKDTHDKVSLQNQKAARKRHTNTDELKREFIRYYESGTHQSKANAAQKFYKALPSEKKKLLKSSNAVRTLTDELRKHLNS